MEAKEGTKEREPLPSTLPVIGLRILRRHTCRSLLDHCLVASRGQSQDKLIAGLTQRLGGPRTKQHTDYLSNESYKPPTHQLIINVIFIFYLHDYNL